MARVNRMSVQKRLRERKKAEKAELKRAQRLEKPFDDMGGGGGNEVATRDDLAGYGLIEEEEEASGEAS
ncbi:MAG: hypothetical protein QNK05_08845 [Myxococcota bacterium]|nr:hypothetical protein [Myxococcota bacterium]